MLLIRICLLYQPPFCVLGFLESHQHLGILVVVALMATTVAVLMLLINILN